MVNCISMCVNGEWRVSSNHSRLEIYNPFNHEHLVTLIEPSKQEIVDLITNSVETFNNHRLDSEQRFQILSKAASLLQERKDEIARVISKDCGKPIRDAESEVLEPLRLFNVRQKKAKEFMVTPRNYYLLQGLTIPLVLRYVNPLV